MSEGIYKIDITTDIKGDFVRRPLPLALQNYERRSRNPSKQASPY